MKKNTKRRKLDILANWSANIGERVEEDDGVVIVTRNKNGDVVEQYDTDVKRKAGLTKCTEPLGTVKKDSKKQKVNNTTVSTFVDVGHPYEILHAAAKHCHKGI